MRKTVIITGAAGGIGIATARLFSKSGWQVVGVDRVQSRKSDMFDLFVEIDLSDPEAAKKVMAQVYQKFGSLYAIVNNAAMQLVKPLVETEVPEWDNVMSVNVRAAFLMIKHGYPLLNQQGGSVVNVSSVHAVATSQNLAAYVTSKGALAALTRAAALELAQYNIRVNAVLPGAIDTQMLRKGLSRDHVSGDTMESKLDDLGRKHVMRKIGKTNDVAEMIFFLTDEDRASFVTGQTFTIDGGATARLSTES